MDTNDKQQPATQWPVTFLLALIIIGGTALFIWAYS